MKDRICVICGANFKVKYPSLKVKVCSYDCKYKLARINSLRQFSSPEARLKTSITTSLAMKRKEVRDAFEKGMKNRRSYKGEGHPLWGVKMSEETKKKIADSNRGKFHGMTWGDIMGESRAQERKLENRNSMLQTNEKLLNQRTSKIEKEVYDRLSQFGFLRNQRVSKYVVDLLNPSSNEIVEVNGDYWHCNPELFDCDFFNSSINMTAAEKWNYDRNRCSNLECLGYNVAVVWESDLKKYGFDILLDRKLLNSLQEQKQVKICNSK